MNNKENLVKKKNVYYIKMFTTLLKITDISINVDRNAFADLYPLK